MEENKQTTAKLSYEELENIAGQLSQQNQILQQRLLESNMANAFKRLDYLFTVLQYKESFNVDFISKVTEEIVDMIDVHKEEVLEEDNK